MLFRIETAVSMGITKPSCTSQLCQWNIPNSTRNILEIKPISELTFIKHHYRKRKNTDLVKVKKQKFIDFSPSYDTQLLELSNEDTVRRNLYNAVKDFAPQSRFVELIEERKKSMKNTHDLVKFPTIIEKSNIFIWDKDLTNKENIGLFTKSIAVTKEEIEKIKVITKQQSESDIWFDQRKGRITASKFHQVFTRMNTLSKNVDTDLTNIFKDNEDIRTFENVATKHGTAMEPHAKSNVTAILKKHIKILKHLILV